MDNWKAEKKQSDKDRLTYQIQNKQEEIQKEKQKSNRNNLYIEDLKKSIEKDKQKLSELK